MQIIDNINHTIGNDLQVTMHKGSKLELYPKKWTLT